MQRRTRPGRRGLTDYVWRSTVAPQTLSGNRNGISFYGVIVASRIQVAVVRDSAIRSVQDRATLGVNSSDRVCWWTQGIQAIACGTAADVRRNGSRGYWFPAHSKNLHGIPRLKFRNNNIYG